MKKWTSTPTEVIDPDGNFHLRLLKPNPKVTKAYADDFNERVAGKGFPLSDGEVMGPFSWERQ